MAGREERNKYKYMYTCLKVCFRWQGEKKNEYKYMYTCLKVYFRWQGEKREMSTSICIHV